MASNTLAQIKLAVTRRLMNRASLWQSPEPAPLEPVCKGEDRADV